MKYIDAEKLYEYLEQVGTCYPRYIDNIVDNAVSNVIDGIKTFVTSLQQEQPSEDLEEEIEGMYNAIFGTDIINRKEMVYQETFRQIALYFVNWQKEQMMKDAVEGVAEELYNDGESQCTVGVGTYFKPGEEVYVIPKEE